MAARPSQRCPVLHLDLILPENVVNVARVASGIIQGSFFFLGGITSGDFFVVNEFYEAMAQMWSPPFHSLLKDGI